MDEELKSWTSDYLDGSLDPAREESLAARLEADPASRADFADQMQLHHRLGVLLRDADPVSAAVVRELKLLPDAPRFSREVVDRVKQIEPAPRRFAHFPIPFWIAAGFFLAVVGVVLLSRPNGPSRVLAGPGPKALFVVGKTPLGDGDAPVLARLEQLSFSVTVIPANQVNVANALGKDVVLISSTALAEDVTDPAAELQYRFREVPVPVLVWEPRLFHPLGMIEGSLHAKDWASTKGSTNLTIQRRDHPLACGLAGRVTVLRTPDRISWGRPGPAAVKVACVEGDDARAAIFTYEKGDAMPGLAAPARRVGFFLFDHTSRELTPEGWRLFDAAVHWSSGH